MSLISTGVFKVIRRVDVENNIGTERGDLDHVVFWKGAEKPSRAFVTRKQPRAIE